MAVPMVEAITARRSWIRCSDGDSGASVRSAETMGSSLGKGCPGARAALDASQEGTRRRAREFLRDHAGWNRPRIKFRRDLPLSMRGAMAVAGAGPASFRQLQAGP